MESLPLPPITSFNLPKTFLTSRCIRSFLTQISFCYIFITGPEMLLRQSSDLLSHEKISTNFGGDNGDASEAHEWRYVRTFNGIFILFHVGNLEPMCHSCRYLLFAISKSVGNKNRRAPNLIFEADFSVKLAEFDGNQPISKNSSRPNPPNFVGNSRLPSNLFMLTILRFSHPNLHFILPEC
jgi:hypothetical protein